MTQPAFDIVAAGQSVATAAIQAAEDKRVFDLLDKMAAEMAPPDLGDWEDGPFW